MGTWKLNEAKSKIGPGAPKNTTVVYEAAGDDVKVTVDGTNADGTPAHNEWTGKFDGKDYPLTGDPNSDTRTYKQVNDHTLALTQKKGSKVTVSGRIVVSADGKSRTVTTSGTDSTGKKVSSTGARNLWNRSNRIITKAVLGRAALDFDGNDYFAAIYSPAHSYIAPPSGVAVALQVPCPFTPFSLPVPSISCHL